MRKYLLRALALTAMLASAAVKPVATLISLGPVRFNSSQLSASGVCFWPVVEGDELATGASAATLLFPDRSRATVYANTRVRMDTRSGKTALILLQGQLGYAFNSGTLLRIVANGQAVELAQPSGTVRLQGDKVSVQAGSGLPPRDEAGPAVLPRLAEYSAEATAPRPTTPAIPSLGRYWP